MSAPMSYVRVFSDASGESHLETLRLAMHTKLYAPPAGPLDVSESSSASNVRILRLATDWKGDWHPSPFRQWLFMLAGSVRVETSDGSTQNAAAGSMVLLEDTSGKGHQTYVTSSTEVIIAAVQVPE